MTLPLHWHTEPLLVLTVVAAVWLHAIACGPLRARLAPGTPYPVGAAVRYHLGVLAAYLAVGSPLDQVGEAYLFSAHMLQHMLLIYVAAPLIASGIPPELLDPWLARSPRRFESCLFRRAGCWANMPNALTRNILKPR